MRKYSALTWPEYYAIKILWLSAPDTLLVITEAQISSVPMEPQVPDAIRLSLLSQIISEISLSVQFGINEVQLDRLVSSSNGLLQWMGLNAIEQQLEKPEGLVSVMELISTLPHAKHLLALGWMVHRAAKDTTKTDTYKGLITALHNALPETLSAEGLKRLVDSMRGHMRQLTWAEPWLFQDVVFPMLQSERANIDDACKIWVRELADLLEPTLKGQSLLFNREREGQTTNISAYLFANSSGKRQQACLKLIQKILKQQQRIVQQPLASTTGWTEWDRALLVSMWILTFTQWSQYYLNLPNMTYPELTELCRLARELAMIRPMDEWKSADAGERSELTSFLDQVEKLLDSRAE